jgi:hypothetical protein
LSPAPFIATGLVTIVAVGALLRAVWPTLAAGDRRALRWLGTGAVLATLVTVGGFPGPRLLLLPGIGGSAVIAAIILHAGKKLVATTAGRAERIGLRFGRGYLVLFHLVLSPLMMLAGIDLLAKMGAATASIDATLDGELGSATSPAPRPRHVVLLAGSDPAAALYVGAARALRSPSSVASWVPLSLARATHHIERVGDRTLRIFAEPGFLHGSFELVFRSSDHPLHTGNRIDLDDVSVTVLSMDGRFPTAIEVVVRSTSIDDPSLLFLAWREGKLVPVHLSPGERIDVPWSAGPTGFF